MRILLRPDAHFAHEGARVGDGVDGERGVGDGVLVSAEVPPVDRQPEQLEVLAVQHERRVGRARSAAQLHLAEDDGARLVEVEVEVDVCRPPAAPWPPSWAW